MNVLIVGSGGREHAIDDIANGRIEIVDHLVKHKK